MAWGKEEPKPADQKPPDAKPSLSSEEMLAKMGELLNPLSESIKATNARRWSDVELEPYKLVTHQGGEFRGASRQVLVGKRGERVKFQLRYFELEPKGFTSLEQHHHSHVVIGARGTGSVRIGEHNYTLRPMDTIYIAPGRPHQLHAGGHGPFGFFCIVDAKRDRPRPVKARSGNRRR